MLFGNKILPLVEGPGVEINTVTSGLFSPEYIRISSQPWIAGRVNTSYQLVASTGNQAFTVSGLFSTGIRITFPDHPYDDHYTVNMAPRGQGLSLFTSFNATSSGEVALFFRNTSGTNVTTELCFVIP